MTKEENLPIPNDLPRDRATINAWARSFYQTIPEINVIYKQLSKLIIDNFDYVENFNLHNLDTLTTSEADAFILCFKQLKTINYLKLFEDLILELLVIGEAFPYAEFNESSNVFDNVIIQNPDYVVVKHNLKNTTYSLRPDENLRRLVLSKDEQDQKTCKDFLNANIIESVKLGNNIKLNDFYFSHII